MKEFDYTAKMLVSIGKYQRMVNHEVNRVRCLPIMEQRKQKWAGTTNRPPNSIWTNDTLSKMNGIGKKTREKLETADVKTIGQLATISDAQVAHIHETHKISPNRIMTQKETAATATLGTCPFPKHYEYVLEQDNPYLHRHGASEWKNKVKKVARSGLTQVACITKLITND
jgi:predicted flap endonuclease-1-like 5' DNA nuclease